ncbi:hypothetical protein C8R43DRAFT_1043613 [Mycena crocata]|nr:hypothetical protein C8R43DRAFT_1043613 [Mycena crocata]
MGLDDFPPELLTRIFLQLSFKSLLCVLAVSAQWNAIVAEDPALKVHMFKSLSKEYVEEGSSEPCIAHSTPRNEIPGADPIRLHPALQTASYLLGQSANSVSFYTNSDDWPRLNKLAIANDFISIPVVTMVKITIPQRTVSPNGFKIKVKNGKGVRLVDVFAALATDHDSRMGTYGDVRAPRGS